MKIINKEKENERLAALKEYKILDTPCEEIFDQITQIAALVCHTPISLINLVDKDRQFTKSHYGLQITEIPREISFCAHTILGPDILEIHDAKQDKRFDHNPFVVDEPHIRFYTGAPLTTAAGHHVGALCVLDMQPKSLSPEQKKTLGLLSKVVIALFELKKSVTSDILERAVMIQKIQDVNTQLNLTISAQKQNNQKLILFSKMNDMLQSCLSYEEAFAVIKNYCQKIFPEAAGTLYLLSSSREHLEPVLSWQDPTSTTDLFSTEDCWALRRGQYYLVDNPNVDVICQHFSSLKKDNTKKICLPMIAQSETLGLLCLEKIHPENNSETQLLYALRTAEQIGLSLASIKLRLILKQQSNIDPLTELYNRRYLIDAFKRELASSIREKKQLGIIIADIDYFKKFNDTYGHDAGDLLLKMVALILKKYLVEHEIACRLGGEEFLLLMRNVNEKEILNRAKRIQDEIHQLKIHFHQQEIHAPTISMGIAIYPLHGKTLDDLMHAADQMLYRAKEKGRDQIILCEQKM